MLPSYPVRSGRRRSEVKRMESSFPLVEPLERILYLRSLPLLSRLAPDELAALAEQLTARDARNAELQSTLSAASARNSALQSALDQVEVGRMELRHRWLRLRGELNSIHKSTSWRLSTPLRWLERRRSRADDPDRRGPRR